MTFGKSRLKWKFNIKIDLTKQVDIIQLRPQFWDFERDTGLSTR